jgi:PilZ domain-containing protein
MNSSLHPGDHVRVNIPALGDVSGQVEEVRDDGVVIALYFEGRRSPAMLENPDSCIEYTTARGLFRQKGSANFDLGGVDIVRFVPAQDAEISQRRGFARVDVHVRVMVTLDENMPALEFQSINISGSGVLLAAAPAGVADLVLGTPVWLSITLSEDDEEEPIQARGTVLRDTGMGSRGVHFDFINDKHRERLVRFLFEQQRLMRQEGRL